MEHFSIVDTHTGGEPTRVVFAGESHCQRASIDDPCGGESGRHGSAESVSAAGNGAIASLGWLRQRADFVRAALLGEPRGCESMVGAWVAAAADARHAAAIVFFNNAGYLGMCGHGLIGVVEAMRYRQMISVGEHRFETPVGVVTVTLRDDRSVVLENVPSYRYKKNVTVEIDSANGDGTLHQVVGDIAYGGNWFFLMDVDEIHYSQIAELRSLAARIRVALQRNQITGAGGADIDHIELSAPLGGDADSSSADPLRGRNFVLCPGGHYDRSPCGTGTSAKIACLAEDGRLTSEQFWTQESIIGSRFTASYRIDASGYRVQIQGRAFVTAEAKCVLDPDDPYRDGIASAMAVAAAPSGDVVPA